MLGPAPQSDRKRYLRECPYEEYLASPEWKEKRRAKIWASGHRCELCNDTHAALRVHHRTYERRGDERFDDLIVLCERCHRIHHGEQSEDPCGAEYISSFRDGFMAGCATGRAALSAEIAKGDLTSLRQYRQDECEGPAERRYYRC